MKNERIIIIGAGGHGKVAADIARLNGYKEIKFLDANPLLKTCLGYPVVGDINDAAKYKNFDFFVAIGSSLTRERIQKKLLDGGFKMSTLVHPNAVVAADVTIGAGSVVMAGAVINPGSRIEEGCIINTGATVDHDNLIKAYAHISVGSHLAGSVTVGRGTWIGAGAVVSNNISICDNCMIGAGAVAVKDINEKGTYIGVPAVMMKK